MMTEATEDVVQIEEVRSFVPSFSEGTTMGRDTINDWMKGLVEKNDKRIREATKEQGLFITKRSAEFVFNACNQLQLRPSVKFCALIMFDRFMLLHIRSVREEWEKSEPQQPAAKRMRTETGAVNVTRNENGNEKEQAWNAIVEKLCGQVVLRLFSCIQLASKVENHYVALKIADLTRLLDGTGLQYTTENMLNSERRVYNTLGQRVDDMSPLVYIETLLQMLHIKCRAFPIDCWYKTCLKVLESVYLLREQVYHNVTKAMLPEGTVITRAHLKNVQADYLFLAGAVIVAAVFTTRGMVIARKIALLLTGIAPFRFEPTVLFSMAIVEAIMMTDEGQFDPMSRLLSRTGTS